MGIQLSRGLFFVIKSHHLKFQLWIMEKSHHSRLQSKILSRNHLYTRISNEIFLSTHKTTVKDSPSRFGADKKRYEFLRKRVKRSKTQELLLWSLKRPEFLWLCFCCLLLLRCEILSSVEIIGIFYSKGPLEKFGHLENPLINP